MKIDPVIVLWQLWNDMLSSFLTIVANTSGYDFFQIVMFPPNWMTPINMKYCLNLSAEIFRFVIPFQFIYSYVNFFYFTILDYRCKLIRMMIISNLVLKWSLLILDCRAHSVTSVNIIILLSRSLVLRSEFWFKGYYLLLKLITWISCWFWFLGRETRLKLLFLVYKAIRWALGWQLNSNREILRLVSAEVCWVLFHRNRLKNFLLLAEVVDEAFCLSNLFLPFNSTVNIGSFSKCAMISSKYFQLFFPISLRSDLYFVLPVLRFFFYNSLTKRIASSQSNKPNGFCFTLFPKLLLLI